MRQSSLLLVALLALACSSGSGGSGKESGDLAQYPRALPDLAQAADRTTPDGDTEAEPQHYPPVTFVKKPWFQWVTPTGFYVHAETVEETPIEVLVAWAGGEGRFYSTPTKPEIKVLEVVLEGLEGFFHQVEVVIPEGTADVSVLVVNGEGFETQLTVPRQQEAFRMVVFGDTRGNPTAHLPVIEAIVQEHPAVALHTGDLVNGGSKKEDWDMFFKVEEALLTSAFFYAVFGNHELFGEEYFDTWFEARDTFQVERNYRVDLGLVGLLVLQRYSTDWTEHDPKQWVKESLEAMLDKRWVLVAHHHPMYTFSNHSPWYEGRDELQPLFEQYGVDMVLAGHNHCYEHFKVNGIHYIVAGGGGAPLYGLDDVIDDEKVYLVAADAIYHYAALDISEEKLEVTVVNVSNEEIFDHFVLE